MTSTSLNASDGVVVDTGHSPFARHRSMPIGNVRLTDDFLAPRLRTNREITIPSQFEHLVTTNRFRNFERVAGTFDGPYDGIYSTNPTSTMDRSRLLDHRCRG